jgi:hypothetical protein
VPYYHGGELNKTGKPKLYLTDRHVCAKTIANETDTKSGIVWQLREQYENLVERSDKNPADYMLVFRDRCGLCVAGSVLQDLGDIREMFSVCDGRV